MHTGFSAKPGGPVWERYSGLGTYSILHFLPPYSPAPFFQTLVIDSENKKAALLVTGEQLKIRSWMPAPFLKIKKAGILMASRHKNPGRFKMITF